MHIAHKLRLFRQVRTIRHLESRLRTAKDRHRPRILNQLAIRYEQAGRTQDAHAAHKEVLASRNPDFSASAALWLGTEREAAGSPLEAEAFYEQAMLFRTEDAFQAAYAHACLRLRQGSLDAARRPLRFAATSGNIDLAISALVSLSALAEQRGNNWGALTLRERADRLNASNPLR